MTFTYDPVDTNRAPGANATSSGELEVICTNATAHAITLDAGKNNSGAQRNMSGPAMLRYDLSFDGSSIAPGGSFSITPTGPGAATTVTIDGSIPGGQLVPAGTYNDTVQATVNL